MALSGGWRPDGREQARRRNGEILDNGADWQVVGDDGTTLVDTRYLLRLDDGALAYLRTQGFRHGPAEVLARIAEGEIVDPSLYYFRVQMLFETASTTYGWLNRTVAVGSALRSADAVVYDAYRDGVEGEAGGGEDPGSRWSEWGAVPVFVGGQGRS